MGTQANGEQVLRQCTVKVVRGAHGPRYVVENSRSGVTLQTAHLGGDAWALVEQHVRASMDKRTPAEQLQAFVEACADNGNEAARSLLVELGMD